ncbi:MAG: toll/interleukin-1 receptor domain-containing protein [Acidobacteriota bacterium]
MRVFISHSSTDEKFADHIRDFLTKVGFQVWDPDRDLLPGSNWLTETGRALEHADAVVLLLSDASLRSEFSKREIQYVTTQQKYENRVVPVRLGTGAGKVPWILRNLSVIEAPAQDPEGTARLIATRLEKPPVRSRSRKRPVRDTPAPKAKPARRRATRGA